MIVVSIILFAAFLWWANSSSIGGEVKRAQQSGDVHGAKLHAGKLTQIRMALVGAVIGAVVGSFFGIAGFGSAIAGTVPGAIIIGLWCYNAGAPSKK
jgi:hypothetical protein